MIARPMSFPFWYATFIHFIAYSIPSVETTSTPQIAATWIPELQCLCFTLWVRVGTIMLSLNPYIHNHIFPFHNSPWGSNHLPPYDSFLLPACHDSTVLNLSLSIITSIPNFHGVDQVYTSSENLSHPQLMLNVLEGKHGPPHLNKCFLVFYLTL